MTAHPSHQNELIHESSPYLLQHAKNPVHWLPWGEKALQRAKDENKLLIISIGYSACHWCHVMEHESFENEYVAHLMNTHFVSVKVDREERPDVDQVYMNALQLMNGNGGWPLNMIALPDGRPLWGGTYIPKNRWMGILEQLTNVFQQKPDEVNKYAEEIQSGMKQFEPKIKPTPIEKLGKDFLIDIVESWSVSFDKVYGGSNHAPKFPLPANLDFLLDYGLLHHDQSILDQVELTLDRMSFGGIYDQLAGGFARYSTDIRWHVPHFEKMLYDNAQLVSLYSKAFRAFGHQRYATVVEETLSFLQTRLQSPEGAFFSALDADSEGEEGKHYVWTKDELQHLLGHHMDLFSDYYQVDESGHWEQGHYVLIKSVTDEAFAEKHQLSLMKLKTMVKEWKALLLPHRDQRPFPLLDDKILTSWNALMLSGFVNARVALHDPEYLHSAMRIAEFISEKLLQETGALFHTYKNGKSAVNGHLDDQALVIRAFLDLYRVTFNETWLDKAITILQYTDTHFLNQETGLYYFTSDEDRALFDRSTDIHDNVMPSGNAVMASNLLEISLLTGDMDFRNRAEKMTTDVVSSATSYPSGYSGWLQWLLKYISNPIEVVVAGSNALEMVQGFNENYDPQVYVTGCNHPSDMSLFKDRFQEGLLLIYVCHNGSCQLPFKNKKEALTEISRLKAEHMA